jgi:hypothetical protein
LLLRRTISRASDHIATFPGFESPRRQITRVLDYNESEITGR